MRELTLTLHHENSLSGRHVCLEIRLGGDETFAPQSLSLEDEKIAALVEGLQAMGLIRAASKMNRFTVNPATGKVTDHQAPPVEPALRVGNSDAIKMLAKEVEIRDAEIERLRKALKEIIRCDIVPGGWGGPKAFQIAKAALGGEGESK